MERKGAYRIGQQKLQQIRRKFLERWHNHFLRFEQWERPFVLNSFARIFVQRDLRDLICVLDQIFWVRFPINFSAAGECSHRIGFDPTTWYSVLLAFNQGGSSATKRVQNHVPCVEGKPVN